MKGAFNLMRGTLFILVAILAVVAAFAFPNSHQAAASLQTQMAANKAAPPQVVPSAPVRQSSKRAAKTLRADGRLNDCPCKCN